MMATTETLSRLIRQPMVMERDEENFVWNEEVKIVLEPGSK